jgi:hypothetical protein
MSPKTTPSAIAARPPVAGLESVGSAAIVNAYYLWTMPSVGSGSRAADPARIFPQVGRSGKPALRLNAPAGAPPGSAGLTIPRHPGNCRRRPFYDTIEVPDSL